MKQANEFLMRFQNAETLAEKEAIATDYNVFYAALAPEQQKQAATVMQTLWPGIQQKVDELDELMAKAKERLYTPLCK